MQSCYGVCGDTAGILYVSCIAYDRIVRIDISTGEIEGGDVGAVSVSVSVMTVM
jgi:hypothetical protein